MGIGNCCGVQRASKKYKEQRRSNRNYFLIASLRFIWLSSSIYLSSGADTLSANQTLLTGETLVSQGENFELGYFKSGNSFNKYYLGIWYKNVHPRTIVWVANRDIPLLGSTFYQRPELIIRNGNLVLRNRSNFDDTDTTIWSTSRSTNVNSTTSTSVVAVLLDNGNFVLRDGASNSSLPIWQSFDYPTDTLLPGGKLSYNKRTNTKQTLTSWTNSEDPAMGRFSLELDPNGSQYVIKSNGSEQYWASGPWNGETFSLLPKLYSYNYSYISNENESYITYAPNHTSNIETIIMDVSGQLKCFRWYGDAQQWSLYWSQPDQLCQVHAICGGFGTCNQNSLPLCNCLTGFRPVPEYDWHDKNYYGGCSKKPVCSVGLIILGELMGRNMVFIPVSATWNRPPDPSVLVLVDNEMECKSRCLDICSCNAYAYNNSGCWVWNGDVFNLQQSSKNNTPRRTIHIKVASSDLPPSEQPTTIGATVKGIISAIVIVVVLLLCSTGFVSHRLRVTRERESRERNQGNSVLREDDKKDIDVPFFEFKSILAATNDFSDANKLGQGGFGPVYKGKLPEGIEIAVKRLSRNSGQGLEEFKNEVVLIAKLQHRNLVRLLGYCMSGDEMILLYEYMPNKSLDHFIFDRTLCMLLDWRKRFEIILGIARGLLYLHQDSRLRIIHKDFKTSNILLDEDMNPKISDFGLAKIVEGRETEASTKRVIGTYGYMSPEYALDGLMSVKSDVFSFGVIVLEIISGKRNSGFYKSEQALSLLGYAWSLWKEEKPLDLMDQALVESCNSSEVLTCITVGLLCVQEDPGDRPTMTNVVFMLGSDMTSLPNPKQPAFVQRKRLSSSPSSSSEPKTQTNNRLTNSMVEGR